MKLSLPFLAIVSSLCQRSVHGHESVSLRRAGVGGASANVNEEEGWLGEMSGTPRRNNDGGSSIVLPRIRTITAMNGRRSSRRSRLLHSPATSSQTSIFDIADLDLFSLSLSVSFEVIFTVHFLIIPYATIMFCVETPHHHAHCSLFFFLLSH